MLLDKQNLILDGVDTNLFVASKTLEALGNAIDLESGVSTGYGGAGAKYWGSTVSDGAGGLDHRLINDTLRVGAFVHGLSVATTGVSIRLYLYTHSAVPVTGTLGTAVCDSGVVSAATMKPGYNFSLEIPKGFAMLRYLGLAYTTSTGTFDAATTYITVGLVGGSNIQTANRV